MTMAGDYEYFASQGKHPFVYALAELVDNALRASARERIGLRPGGARVVISLLIGSDAASSAVCVADVGVGMSKRELNQWAVMNLSMEDRNLLPVEPAVPVGCSQAAAKKNLAPTRFLTSDLSFFGVGSKNACFYLGASTTLVTKQAEACYVHELRIAADELERRYVTGGEGGGVWQEDLVHRNPADATTISPYERKHTLLSRYDYYLRHQGNISGVASWRPSSQTA